MPGDGKSARSSARGDKGASQRGGSKGKDRSESIAHMKALLIERRDAITRGMQQNLDYHSSPPLTKGDSSDLAADSLDSDTTLQIAESGSSEIAQIDEALRKIEEGTYGICESCGGEIPWARLQAAPYATMCVECKRKQEMENESSGTSGWSAVDEMEAIEPLE